MKNPWNLPWAQLAPLLAVGLLPALAFSAPKSKMQVAECVAGTERDVEFHMLSYYPFEHSLRFPGMIVGIEKSKSPAILEGARAQDLVAPLGGIDSSPRADAWLEGKLRGQSKAMFISHIAMYDSTATPQLLYSVYPGPADQPDSGQAAESPNSVKLEVGAGSPAPDACDQAIPSAGNLYEKSWSGLERVRAQLSEKLATKEISHVLLLIMGWNTSQIESIQNFNSVVRQLTTAKPSGLEFKPFVIGVTWPSQWSSSMFEAIVRPASLLNKANDADEIGGGWLSALLKHSLIPPARTAGVPIVAVGHSFGARALTHAVCRGTRLKPPETSSLAADQSPSEGSVAWTVSLQGAYSLNRFRSKGAGPGVGLSYEPGCPVSQNLLFTSSDRDTAGNMGARAIGGGNFAGSAGTWESARKDPASFSKDGKPPFSLYRADKFGGLTSVSDAGAKTKFHYVNANDLIYYDVPLSGGGAHSDIYRLPTATMLWKMITSQPATK